MERNQIFILAAGHNKKINMPCSLWSLSNETSILDWQLNTFKSLFPDQRITIIIGYKFQEITKKYQNLDFQLSLNWKKNNALQTFLDINCDLSSSCTLMYGDTVFHSHSLSEFKNNDQDVIIGIDSNWKKRFDGRTKKDMMKAENFKLNKIDVEYTGLIKFSPKVLKYIFKNKKLLSGKNFIFLIKELIQQNFKIKFVNLNNSWAEMNDQNDLAQFILGTKSDTLKRLRTKVSKSIICDQLSLDYEDWKVNKKNCLLSINNKFPKKQLIIRSSASDEDSWVKSNAGSYKSVANINADSSEKLSIAIDEVFNSYKKDKLNSEVLIQPYIFDIKIAGVIFTCDLNTGAPYYVINYDEDSALTDSVTSGKSKNNKTFFFFKNARRNIKETDPLIKKIINAASEIEQILGYYKLDIEFAIDKDNKIYTFQVRPITVKHNNQHNYSELSTLLNNAQKQYKEWQKPPKHILGDKTVFSTMTDWNPAEIIGLHPNPLALSLYTNLITNDSWAKQRCEFGYRNTRPSPLVHNFCSQPYVDCRAVLNSFIPSKIPDKIAEKIVNDYIDMLVEQPNLHDKVEFDIAFTIWTPLFNVESQKRFKHRRSRIEDIKLLGLELKKITSKTLLTFDKKKFSTIFLKDNLKNIIESDLNTVDKIYNLLHDCREYGINIFAHAARLGFISITLIKTMVTMGVITRDRADNFQASIKTVASDYIEARKNPKNKIKDLIKEFGHLRPGTYDINNLAYWEQPNKYFNKIKQISKVMRNDNFKFDSVELEKINKFAKQFDKNLSSKKLINFLKHTIQLREEIKFEFTKYISLSLDMLVEFGKKELKISRKKLGFLTFEDISLLRIGNINYELIKKSIENREELFFQSSLAKLPDFISCETNFYMFSQEVSRANYISNKSITNELIFVENYIKTNKKNIILAIPNADPGYDWIFSIQLSGLITMYGGANSHMAIRCAELKIPAAIGVGEKIYNSLSEGLLFLDCANGIIKNV